jgi:zinc transport system substrate-binding protein
MVVAALLAVLALLAAGCSSSDGTSGADGDRLSVTVSVFPLADAAEHVGGDLVEVTNLTPPGVEPHDLELTPDDIEAIQSADVVLLMGGGFQPAVEDAASDAEGVVVDVLVGLGDRVAPPVEEDEHADEELTVDPHVWLDPELYAIVVDEVATTFAEADLDGRDQFEANAADYREELDALDEEYAEGLSSCQRTLLVTNHAAFGYLASAYGLTQEPISINPGSEPDPARLADLNEIVQREGVTTIFTEDLVSPEVAETLASEAGVQTVVLSPMDAVPEGGQDYLSVMRDNLQTLRQALGCG